MKTISLQSNLLSIKTIAPSLYELISYLRPNSDIKINFHLDYKANLWDNETMSQYIELILLSIPTNNFYFNCTNFKKWVIIDGYNRLLALKKFIIDKTLKLVGLKYTNTISIEGLTWNDIGRSLQRKIEGYQTCAYIIEPGSNINESIDIMNKINDRGFLMEVKK